MLKDKLLPILLILVLLSSVAQAASTDAPVLKSARFDTQGRLVVQVKNTGQVGCYLSVIGGLSAKKIDTGITAIQVNSKTRDPVRIRTIRKYRCAKRTLYLNILRECYTDPIGSATSNSLALSVPDANR